jgi:protein SCO1
MRRHARVLIIAAAMVAGICAGMVMALALHRPAQTVTGDANAATAAAPLQPRPAPNFTLTDQDGNAVSLAAQRGHWVLLTFLDPQCTTLCPVMGRDIGALERSLPASVRPTLLVVSVAPGRTDTDVRHFLTTEHPGWSPGWHWLLGPNAAALQLTWLHWNVEVAQTPADVVHDAVLDVIDPQGRLRVTYGAPLDIADIVHSIGLMSRA